MKRILVLSDSHGCYDLLCSAADFTCPDQIIHLGDVVEDSHYLSEHCFHLPVVRLKGNCDYGSDLPEFYFDRIEEVSVFACHGHQYHVKYGLTAISYAAQEKKANLCLFGHTHVRWLDDEGDITLLNPGACSGSLPHCALITISNGDFSVVYLRFGKEGWYYL